LWIIGLAGIAYFSGGLSNLLVVSEDQWPQVNHSAELPPSFVLDELVIAQIVSPAPQGTPVRAASDGTIIQATTDANGKTVRLLQNNGFATVYRNLLAFAAGIRPGVHVDQNKVVAYAGLQGLQVEIISNPKKGDGAWAAEVPDYKPKGTAADVDGVWASRPDYSPETAAAAKKAAEPSRSFSLPLAVRLTAVALGPPFALLFLGSMVGWAVVGFRGLR